MRKLLFLLLTLFFMCNCTGCANMDYFIDFIFDSAQKNDYEKAIESVEEKYGIEIEPFRYENGSYVSEGDIIRGHVEGLDEETEYIQIRISEKDGEKVYQDNYLNYVARPIIEEHLKEFFIPYFDEFKIYYDNELTYHPNTLNQNSTIEDIIEESESYMFEATVFMKEDGSTEEEYAERMMHVEEAIIASGETVRIELYVVDEESYNQMDRYNKVDFLKENNFFEKPDNVTLFYYYNESIYDGKKSTN